MRNSSINGYMIAIWLYIIYIHTYIYIYIHIYIYWDFPSCATFHLDGRPVPRGYEFGAHRFCHAAEAPCHDAQTSASLRSELWNQTFLGPKVQKMTVETWKKSTPRTLQDDMIGYDRLKVWCLVDRRPLNFVRANYGLPLFCPKIMAWGFMQWHYLISKEVTEIRWVVREFLGIYHTRWCPPVISWFINHN